MALLFVGTYGERLGHVDGKAKGIYAARLDRAALSAFAPSPRPRHAFPDSC
jgi:hypothetical protein